MNRPAMQLAILAILGTPAAAQLTPGQLLVNVWLGDHEVIQIEPDGTLVRNYDMATGSRAQGAAITASGEVLVSRWLPERGFSLFDSSGVEVAEFDAPEIHSATGDTAAFSSGELAVVDQSGLVRLYREDGTDVRTIGRGYLRHPTAIHVDDQDRLWVSETVGVAQGGWLAADVFVFHRKGRLLSAFDVGFRPGDLVVAPDGTVWTIDQHTGVVHRFTEKGVPLGSFPTVVADTAVPIAMEADGNLVVGSWLGTQLHRYAQDGTYLGPIPVPGMGAGGPLYITVVGS